MAPIDTWKGVAIYTIGHAGRTVDEFVTMLRSFDVSVVADIRACAMRREHVSERTSNARAGVRAVDDPGI
jgi:uncharacterized protein (DUF488 family)